MKNFKSIPQIAVLLLLIFTVQAASAGTSSKTKKNIQQDFITIRGKVVDKESGNPLVFATVAVKESNVAIVTNIDGEFTLKIVILQLQKPLKSHFSGSKTKLLPLMTLRKMDKNVIALEAAPIPIKEIIVKPLDPIDIVSESHRQHSKKL